MTRTIQAPGVELREIDQSYEQRTQDNSIVGTVSFINGFADKGEDYTTRWINSIQTLQEVYGIPTNEPEMYFHNAIVEVLNKGGICIASKLPYANNAFNTFNVVDYTLEDNLSNIADTDYRCLSAYDSSLEKIWKFKDDVKTQKINLDALDELKTNNKIKLNNNTIRIVDISRTNYESLNLNCVSTDFGTVGTEVVKTNECAGIMPVIVTPTNALYFQNFKDETVFSVEGTAVSAINNLFNNVNGCQMTSAKHHNSVKVDLKAINSAFVVDFASSRAENNEKFENSSPTESISKITSELFPAIQHMNSVDSLHLDQTYLKSIGIVVLKLFRDTSNWNQINFSVLESFVGSLDSTQRNDVTKASMYIDDVVNSQSRYINVFTKFSSNSLIQQADIIAATDLKAASLGFYRVDLRKIIDFQTSITGALNTIFTRNSDANRVQIDLVVDAGVSNLGALSKVAPQDYTFQKRIKDHVSTNQSAEQQKGWRTVMVKYDDFCKNIRKDCMYLADGLRSFCVVGDEKIVRNTNLNSSIEKDILPQLKNLVGVNSSYSAGYCDWFYVQDYYTKDYFWVPPSVKASGVYTYTDAYFHKWDAPAGIIRGRVNNAIDCAFSPNINEAGKIYLQSWNYAVNYPIDGIVLEGQKTFQLKKTAFDRVNVRRLFLHLEKSVVRVAKYFLYQGNTEYLRQRFVDTIKPIFQDAVSGYGIQEYIIKCDNTNNTVQTIENNELHCQIAVKPVKTIEYIVLDFRCTNQSATVNETIFS